MHGTHQLLLLMFTMKLVMLKAGSPISFDKELHLEWCLTETSMWIKESSPIPRGSLSDWPPSWSVRPFCAINFGSTRSVQDPLQLSEDEPPHTMTDNWLQALQSLEALASLTLTASPGLCPVPRLSWKLSLPCWTAKGRRSRSGSGG